VKSRCYKCKISSTLLAANIAVEQEVTVNAVKIVLFIFTRFWHTVTHVPSKASSKFALRHRLAKWVYKTCAHVRCGSCPMLERLVDVCSW